MGFRGRWPQYHRRAAERGWHPHPQPLQEDAGQDHPRKFARQRQVANPNSRRYSPLRGLHRRSRSGADQNRGSPAGQGRCRGMDGGTGHPRGHHQPGTVRGGAGNSQSDGQPRQDTGGQSLHAESTQRQGVLRPLRRQPAPAAKYPQEVRRCVLLPLSEQEPNQQGCLPRRDHPRGCVAGYAGRYASGRA